MTLKTKKWLRAGIELLLHGIWGGGIAALAAWQIDPKDWAWGSPNFTKMAFGMFWANGGLRAAQYFWNNPLPPADSDIKDAQGNSIVPTPTISLNPLAKVQTLSKTTAQIDADKGNTP